MTVECTSKVLAEHDDRLTAADVAGWVQSLPPAATVSAIIHDLGDQRDPYRVLVGLTAKWQENRP